VETGRDRRSAPEEGGDLPENGVDPPEMGGARSYGEDGQICGRRRKREEICRKMGGYPSAVEMGKFSVGAPEKGEIGQIWGKEMFEGKSKG
jgi:hypothetical protein